MLQLLQGQKAGALYLVNQDDEPHTYQIKALLWLADGDQQKQDPTDDVILSPAVMTIPAKGTQIVRYGLRHPAPAKPEIAYRVIVDEIPSAEATKSGALNMLLRISLPMFVRDRAQPPPPDLAASWSVAGGLLHVAIANPGPYPARVLKAEITGPGAPADLALTQLHYVLPGGRTDFPFPLPAGHWLPHGATVTLESDNGTLKLALAGHE